MLYRGYYFDARRYEIFRLMNKIFFDTSRRNFLSPSNHMHFMFYNEPGHQCNTKPFRFNIIFSPYAACERCGLLCHHYFTTKSTNDDQFKCEIKSHVSSRVKILRFRSPGISLMFIWLRCRREPPVYVRLACPFNWDGLIYCDGAAHKLISSTFCKN